MNVAAALVSLASSVLLLAIAGLAVTGAPADAQSCGVRPSDWCPAPPGDPCGRHGNVAACRADEACFGMPYVGESVVACILDARGFGSNCPTVGCTSTPPARPK